MASKRLPYTSLDPDFLTPRDPLLGFIKVGGKEQKPRFARGSGKPWAVPVRFVNPPRFEVTTREKRIEHVQGQGKAKKEKFPVDLGFVRDEAFHTAIDDAKPTTLKIRLLYPMASKNVINFLGAHSGSGWECRGNGVEAQDVKRGECVCPCPRLAQFEGKYKGAKPTGNLDCKPHGELVCLLEDAEIFGGFWAFKTTSYESISNILKTLQILEDMFGRVDGLPLELRVQAATIQSPGGKTTQPIVNIVLAASMNTARQVAADAAAESRKFLPAGTGEDFEQYRIAAVKEIEEAGPEYAGEFLPETIDPDGAVRADAVVGEPEEPEDEGPDHEVVEEKEAAPAETEAKHGPGADKATNDPGPEPEPEPEDEPEPRKCPDCGNVLPGDEPCADCAAENAEVDEAHEAEIEEAEETCRALLKELGWDAPTINSRIEHHRRDDAESDMIALRDRLEKHYPDVWATVHGAGDEPADELAG